MSVDERFGDKFGSYVPPSENRYGRLLIGLRKLPNPADVAAAADLWQAGDYDAVERILDEHAMGW